MSSHPRIREELLEPLRRVLAWLLSLRDAQGRIVCPEHKLEHTGKSAGAAVLAARLALYDAPERRSTYVAAAIQQGRRLVANLRREGTSECHTFWPGRHDPFNSSNAVIDGGACSAALAELVELLATELTADDAQAFRDASVLHARTYLRYAVLDKGIPAQRAWGLTGLAAAWRLARDPVLEAAAIEAIGALEGAQNHDGSFPYHPLEWGAEHPGASDASAFYHSRIPAFTLYALERLGREPTDRLFAGALYTALDFAEALHGPDGIKCGLIEAKPWYWGAEYEVASHVFDVFALARAARVYAQPHFGRTALRAFRTWVAHLTEEGVPRSHMDAPGRGKSYQCPVFWACHAEWIARALPDLEELSAREASTPRSAPAVRHFADAQLVRLEDAVLVAWVRGARPPYNVHHGSPHGGGLLRVVRKSDGALLVTRTRLAAQQDAEWSGRAGAFKFSRGWEHGASALRFSLWLARNHARGGRYAAAFGAPFDVWRRGVLGFASSEVSSGFDREAQLVFDASGVTLRSALAWRGGERVPNTTLLRRFAIDGRGLCVNEERLGAEGVRNLVYNWPAAATERVEGAAGSHTLSYRLT